ncbi:MAG: hypothetical protein H6909_05195 [Rickettsiaceae bacterium]|nr:hypothetical protein [Rickettsiaceae bacterium]
MNIDIAIVVVFLLLNLGVGLYYGRGVTNIKEYAVGKQNFTTASIVSTVVATSVTGSLFIIGMSKMYTDGLCYFLPVCGLSVSLYLTAKFIIPRMKSFMGSISIAESLGNRYGIHARIITAICAVISNFGGIAIQYTVLGNAISYFFSIEVNIAIILTGITVTLYSAFGGIRSVTITDILQFMVFGTVIPLIGIILWKTTLNLGLNYNVVLEESKLQLSDTLNLFDYNFWTMLSLFIYVARPDPYPAIFQRIMMSKNLRQAQRVFNISSIVMLIIVCSIAWISFLLLTIDPHLEPNQLLPHIIDNYSYSGLKGFIIVGVIAMVMSSADSFINVASVMVIHDIYMPLKFNFKNELLLTRITAIIIGIVPIWIALVKSDLLLAIGAANAFYIPIVTVPLLTTIFGFKTTKKVVLSGMAAGFCTVIIWKIMNIYIDPITPAALVNFLTMMVVHYLYKQPGGWCKVEMEEADDLEESQQLGVFSSIYYSIKHFNFIDFIHKNSPRDEATYSFFGIFCFISTLSTIYLTHRELLGIHSDFITYLYCGMLIISTFFGLHMMWSDRIRNPIFVSIIWHIALVYNMTFCTSFFLLISNFHAVQIIVFTLSLMVLFNLCRWKTAILVTIIGVGIGIVTYKSLIADISLSESINNIYIIIYVSLVATASLFAFYKPKEDHLDNLDFQIFKRDRQLNFLNQKIYNYEYKVSILNSEVNHSHNEMAKLKNAVQEREKKIIELAEEIRTAKRNIKELNNSTLINDGRSEEIYLTIKEREAELLAIKDSIINDKNKIEILKHEVLDKSAIIKNLDSQISNSKHQIEILKDEIQKREEKISNLSEEVVFFKERNINHEMEIERLGATAQKILNNVNHELRLPVGNVVNFAEMLSEGLEKYTKEQQKELLDEVLQNSNRLSSMILNMLDLATMNVKNVNLNKQKINISELIEDRIVRCRKIYLQDKPLEMIVSIQPGIIASIDKHYIQQTIDNIIINAIKFTQKGVIKVNAYIENDSITIIVADEGIGIPKNELYDIFTPFKMGSNTASKAEGRGVGLALCKAAIEAHGGVITVESNGYGATFRVILPF